MIKRILIITMLSLALLLTLTVSLGMAQQGTTGRTPEVDAPEQVTSRSSYIPVQGRLTDSSGNPLNGTFQVDFKIYDTYTGTLALCEDLEHPITVENGLFSNYMEMQGCSAFDGRQLYLGITVEDDPEMTPRQFIDNVPYAWSLRPGAVISATSQNAVLHIENWADDGRGLRAYAMSLTGENYGIVGASRSPDGFGGYFYNTGAGVALKSNSDDGTAISASSINGIGLIASSTDASGVWATSVNFGGVHGASGNGAGVEGFSVLGPGVYGESLTGGVAIAAKGVITSTAPTYLWVSGNDVRAWSSADSTIINLNSHGGAQIQQGTDAGTKNVVLPITIAGTLYGQNVKLTALDIYWQGETEFDSISAIRLRRQTGACGLANTCYVEILVDLVDKVCWKDDNPTGCIIHYDLTSDNILTPESGILYLTVAFVFSGETTYIDFGGARLTLAYDN